MDPKELKSALKSARECIKNKEYREALKHCKAILAQDKNNYNALVFVGVAADGLDQHEQTVKAYRRASEADPEQPLAWQGLSGFYEKHPSPENDKALVEVYLKLTRFFESDINKKIEVTKKLVNLHTKLGNVDMGLELLDKLCSETTDESVKCGLRKDILSLLSKLPSLTLHQEDKLIDMVDSLLTTDSKLDEEVINLYIDILLKKKDSSVLRVSCRMICEKYPCLKYPIEVCAEVTSQPVLILRGHILLKLNRAVEAEEILSNLEVCKDKTALEGCVMFYKTEYTKSAAIFYELMKQDDSNSQYHLMYAKALWFDRERLQDNLQACHTAFLKSAKLDPYHSEPFEYLGRFYTEVQRDRVKGKRCFQKAFDLDGNNDRAGEALCDLMNELGEEEDAFQLLLSVTSKASAGCCKWAWLRLGLYQVKHDTTSVAISSFQSALRADPKDPHVWECLAEAYYKRGSYTAALKAFTKASELNPNSVYSLYMIACIKQTLRMLTEAIEEYRLILKDAPNYVPALKGMGETYVLLAKHHLSEGFNGRAKQNCQTALQYLTRDKIVCERHFEKDCFKEDIRAKIMGYTPKRKLLKEDALPTIFDDSKPKKIRESSSKRYEKKEKQELINRLLENTSVCHRPDLSCLWKLMGDSCTIIHPLPSQNFRFEVPENLYRSKESTEKCELSILQTLELGARCYGRALKLLPDCAYLWHDLGFNLYQQSLHSEAQDSVDVANKSVDTLRKGLSLDPVNHQIWNLLGLVYCCSGLNKPSLGQHCFIKSIKSESANVVAWTNLATLYMKNGNIELAHEAYKVAQSLDPSYVSCWIGQAMIAETVGDDDAMDLFRHTTELSPHVEGSLGYAHWVCTLLQDKTKHGTEMYSYAIHQMSAVPAASDALVRYLDLIKTNPGAYNMYGLLKEQQGLYRTARDAFQRAVELLEPSDILLNQVKINLARTLCKLGEYSAALSLYTKLGDLESLHDLCHMGLAFYKLQKYTESYQAYDKALEISNNDINNSHIHAVQGMVAYKFGDIDGAKSSLFQSSQLQPSSRNGLEALCALGLKLRDATLTQAVLQELSESGADNSSSHLNVIYQCLLENNWEQARSYTQKSIHKSPDSHSLWRLLSRLLLRHCHGNQPSTVAVCAQTALCLMPKYQDVQTDVAVGQLKDGRHVSKDTNNNALRSAQRAVLINPEKLENWCTFVSAVHSDSVLEVESKRVTALIKAETSYLTWLMSASSLKEALRSWCQKQLTVAQVLSGEITKESLADDLKKYIEELKEGNLQADSNVEQIFKLFKTLLSDGGNDEVSKNFGKLTDSTTRSTTSDPLILLMKAVILMKTNPKLAKHRLVDVLVTMKTTSSQSPLIKSVTRRCLLHILQGNPEKEAELIQLLVTEATEDGDVKTVNFYQRLFNDS
ncbi:SKI3 subunit of superkiller complex protein-like [Ostrea edulis]|uniref:SKI3 subunit of superkiller complex protein-like n=1 Tax=Ostrea edulis TaxID=37623 RepID=UPI0024AEEC5B|nr:SKI3 subunit of superkiller complex protein-like [Ostrea edulis]